MADTTPLLASLLMGQRQEYNNPFAQQRKYGEALKVKGSSTAPLQGGGWLEGLSRALQGGIGGVVEGLANQQEEAQNKGNIDIYSQAAAERDPQKAAELLKGLKGGGYQQEALLGQIIQNNINEGLKQQQAQGTYNRSGAPTASGVPAAGGAPSGQGATLPPEWDQHIQTAAQATGLPPALIKSVALAESGGKANAVSPAGAGGPMQ